MSGSVASARSQRSERSHQSKASVKSQNSIAVSDASASQQSYSSKNRPRPSSSKTTTAPPIISSSNASVASYSSRQSTSSKISAASHRSSSASVKSHQSQQSHQSSASSIRSHHSNASASTASTTSTTSASISPSLSSHRSIKSQTSSKSSRSSKTSTSTATSRSSKTIRSTRGEKAASLRDHGIDHLESGDYALAILSFTQALSAYQKNEGGNPPEGGTEERIERTLATMYGYRCHALYYIGAYEGAVRDGRNALECERIAGCKRTLLSALGSSPYTTAGKSSASSNLLHPEKGSVLRAKVLTFLACSLLRQGILEGVADAFDGSMDVASKALEDAEDLTEGERMSSVTHEHAVSVAKSTIQQAKEGLKTMERYEALKTKLEHNSRGKYSIADFDEALSIAPAAVVFHEEKLKFLIGRKRWFSVANHCEQMAANAVKMDGVHIGDLADLDPFPGISPVEELSAEIFEDRSGGGKGGGLPPYLRTLSTKAACDAVFRLPKEIVPYYLRSLRLEERYGAAVKAGRALMDFDAQAEKEQDLAKFVDRKILSREVDKLERTIKLKEEGDALFRDGYFDRAAALYGECLVIDEEGNNSGSNGSLGRASSVRFGDVSGSKAFAKAASAGGRLHAILHSNRAACFSSLGRYQDAVVESSHAIEIHNMYMKAILRRARCFAKIGENNRAQTDFNRWLALVHGSKSMPFPPLNQGPACFFDMPSEVSKQEVNAVKSEMNELGLSPPVQNPSMRNRMSINPPNISLRKPNSRGSSSSIRRKKRGKLRRFLESISSFFESLGCPACMKRDVSEQVVVNEPGRGSTRSMAGTQYGDNLRDSNKSGRSTSSSRSVSGRSTSSRSTSSKSISSAPQRSSLKKDPPPSVNPLIKSRPAFDHPLDPPSEIDASVDHYKILGLERSASQMNIKQAYFRLAKENHPDRNDSEAARTKFHEIKTAYDMLGNKEKKRAYDRVCYGGLQP